MITLFENFNKNNILGKLSCKLSVKNYPQYKDKIFEIREINYNENRMVCYHSGLPKSVERKKAILANKKISPDITLSFVKFYDIVEIFPHKECDCVECIETLEYGQDAKRYNL